MAIPEQLPYPVPLLLIVRITEALSIMRMVLEQIVQLGGGGRMRGGEG